MKKLERLLAVLQGKEFDRVPFTADLGWWYNVNRERGTLPNEYSDMDLKGIPGSIGSGQRMLKGLR